MARNTVITAYDLLIAEGYVSSRPGATAVVADIASRRAPSRAAMRPVENLRINALWRKPFLSEHPRSDLPARSFRLGMPDHRFFPHEIWRRLTAQALRQGSRARFSYPPSEGMPALREAIAGHVAFTRAVACTADDVIVTSGAQQAFDLLGRLLVTPGQTAVAVEDPGYPPLRAALFAAGAKLIPVPVDDEGLCVDRIPHDVRIISVTPSHQSPTGVAMSKRRREELLDFARTRDALVLEDDYDGEFRFSGRPLDALQTLDRDDRVFYIGTFSKSMFPSLRKGFIVAPAWARDLLVTVKQCVDSHCDAMTQTVLAAFIREGHLARHVRRMQPLYGARRRALLDGIKTHLDPWLEVVPSEAGLHLAARIRTTAMAPLLIAQARQFTPGAQSIAQYALNTSGYPALAFGYGVIDTHEITAALTQWGSALNKRT